MGTNSFTTQPAWSASGYALKHVGMDGTEESGKVFVVVNFEGELGNQPERVEITIPLRDKATGRSLAETLRIISNQIEEHFR